MTDSHRPEPVSRERPTTWPPVLTVGDVAALLGLQSERVAREFIAREGVPHVRKGKRVLVLLDSLVAWLKANEITSSRAPTRRRSSRPRTTGAPPSGSDA